MSLSQDIVDTAALATQKVKRFLSSTSSSSAAVSSSVAVPQSVVVPPSSHHTRLAKLSIKKFDGDPLNWQQFEDVFWTNVGRHSDLEGCEKLSELLKYLDDEAMKPIAGIRVTNDNFDVAWNTLKEKYGDPQVAIFAHFEKLYSVPSAQTDSSVRLGDIYDECEKHIRSLVALGVEEDKFGIAFTSLILTKLPRNVRTQLIRNKGSRPWDLQLLRTLMKQELDALDQSERFNVVSKPSSSKSHGVKQTAHSGSFFPGPASKPPFQRKILAPTQGAMLNQNSSVTCAFCDGNHFSDGCAKVKSPEDRVNAIKNKGCCFKCLHTGHRSDDCQRSKMCYYCKSTKHHSSICRKRGDPNSPSTDFKPGYKASSTKMVNPVNGSRQVQMKMASVYFPQAQAKKRIFLDDGSSRTYVTSACAKALNLKIEGEQSINCAHFGAKILKSDVCGVATLTIPVVNGSSVSLSVLVTDHICVPIQKYAVDVEQNPVLRLLPLADTVVSETCEVPIDILIGQDYYEDVVGSERISLTNGMKLVSSIFGYILCGRLPGSANDKSGCALTTVSMVCGLAAAPPSLDQQLEHYFSLDSVGIKDNAYNCDDDTRYGPL